MDNNKFRFTIDDREHEMEMVFVEGTKGWHIFIWNKE